MAAKLPHAMKINYCSDLHLNQCSKQAIKSIFEELSKPAEFLIIAGDFFSKNIVNYSGGECSEEMIFDHQKLIQQSMQVLSDFKNPVFWIPGNHEFHGMKIADLEKEYQSIIPSNVEFLHNKTSKLGNYKIVGSTMWYDVTDYKGSSTYHIHDFIDDFPLESSRCKSFLENEVTNNSIVVTHMLPSYQSVHSVWRAAKSNVVFVREMDDLILNQKPHIWFYGHSHNPVDEYFIGSTKLLTNPRGSNKEIKQNQSWTMKTLELPS